LSAQPSTPPATVDVLSDVLRTVRLTGALFFPMEVSSPWIDAVPRASDFASILLPGAQHVVSYHIIRKGQCWAAVGEERPVRLQAGDVFVVPHGDPYTMASAPDLRPTMPPESVLEFFREMATTSAPLVVSEGGGGPERAEVVCGFLGCDLRPFNPVLEALPRALYLGGTSERTTNDRVSQLVEIALAESREGQSGARCVLLHLSELLFVEVVRRCLHSLSGEQIGWLAGLTRLRDMRWRCSTTDRRIPGRWRDSRKRLASRDRCWPNASVTSLDTRRCAISLAGASSSHAGCCAIVPQGVQCRI
jgi:hypothetical protein